MDFSSRKKTILRAKPTYSIALVLGIAVAFPIQGHSQTGQQPAQVTPPAKPALADQSPGASAAVDLVKPPLTVRIESAAPMKFNDGERPEWWTYWIPVIGPIISGLLSGLIAYSGVRLSLDFAKSNNEQSIAAAQKASEAAIWQKANETEYKDIIAKLDRFYGPLMQMSQANHLVIEEFRSRQPPGFRTLPKVFDPEWLYSLPLGDRKVVEEVCYKGGEIEKFITDNSGNADEKVLPYLARACAHFHILKLAYLGKLGTDPENFLKYVYPKQLDCVLKLEVKRLRERCDNLRAHPATAPGPMPPLVIPPELALEEWNTVDMRVYQSKADSAPST